MLKISVVGLGFASDEHSAMAVLSGTCACPRTKAVALVLYVTDCLVHVRSLKFTDSPKNDRNFTCLKNKSLYIYGVHPNRGVTQKTSSTRRKFVNPLVVGSSYSLGSTSSQAWLTRIANLLLRTARSQHSSHHFCRQRSIPQAMSGPPGRGLQTSAGISPVIAPLVEENIPSRGSVAPNSAQPKHRYERFLLADDYRRRLPSIISRFTGYRSPGSEPPYDPLPFPPFSWLVYIPLKVEVWIFAWIGAFGGVLLIEAIMSTTTVFRDAYHSPIIITSFGASAVLVFGVIESPLAQPRNFVIGQFLSALVGTAITRLFILNRSYQGYLDNTAFHGDTFINGALSMATSLLAMLILSDVHPPLVLHPL